MELVEYKNFWSFLNSHILISFKLDKVKDISSQLKAWYSQREGSIHSAHYTLRSYYFKVRS